MITVIDTRLGYWARITATWRAWRLRKRIERAEVEIFYHELDLTNLPHRIAADRKSVAELRVELIDAEQAIESMQGEGWRAVVCIIGLVAIAYFLSQGVA